MSRLALFSLLLVCTRVSAQPPAPAPVADPTRITLDRLFNSKDFQGESVPGVRWLDGGAYLSEQKSKTHPTATDLVRVDATGKVEILLQGEKLLPAGAKEPLSIHGYEWSRDLDLLLIYTNSARVWRQNTRGDYWTYRRSTNKLVKLGGEAKPSTMMFAKLSPDGTRVGYVVDNDLYIQSVDGGAVTRLTLDGSPEVINGTFDWVYEEEFDGRDGWRWSPDGKRIAYWQLDTRGVKTFTMIDNTTDKYPILKTFAYPKTGERNSACRIGVVGATGGTTTWMAIPGDTKTDYYLPRMQWAGNPNELVIQRINRLQNAIDVVYADASTGKAKIAFTDRDGAWIDLHDDAMDWLDKGASFTWISERDGWRHLSVVSRDGTTTRRVSRGDFDVIRVIHIDEKLGKVYFLASPENPTQHYLYQMALNGTGTPERITPATQPGWHDYQFSPEGTLAVHSYSTFGSPPRVELISLPDHKVVRPLANNDKLRETIGKLGKTPAEFFRVDVGNGVKLDGWLMKPAGFDPAKKYPLVMHVYGEPAGQTVTDRWGGMNYLWHLMLTQQGYAVACVDNRGTPAPRGRDWRKSVYRQIGRIASDDQAGALRELLKQQPALDPARVGIWGWSGGGSMTLNMMFRHPELYRTGMSVAPVPDMNLYDTIYQERYMGLPQENAEDYRLGSPITHAAGLKGNLLLVHGTGDDNCHYQGMEKLTNKLIELNKPFTSMPYPNRSHSINEGKNTTRHLYTLMTNYLQQNLPVVPK